MSVRVHFWALCSVLCICVSVFMPVLDCFDFTCSGSKITVDGHCCHEIKRGLLLGRKAMTNLDSVLKSRHHFNDKDQNCGAGEDSWESLGQQGDQISQSSRKSSLNIHWKDWCWNWSSVTLATQCEDSDSLEKTLMLGKTEGKRRRGQQRMRWLDSITDSVNMNLSKLWDIEKDRETWCAAVHRVAKRWTWLSDWTMNNSNKSPIFTHTKVFFSKKGWKGIWLMLEVCPGMDWIPYMKVKVAQSCPTLWDPIDYLVHGILLAGILEWGAIPFSGGSS